MKAFYKMGDRVTIIKANPESPHMQGQPARVVEVGGLFVRVEDAEGQTWLYYPNQLAHAPPAGLSLNCS